VTPLYPQKLALTSPTGGGRSVGIVRVRTKATEFSVSASLRISFLIIQWIIGKSYFNNYEDSLMKARVVCRNMF